MIIVKRAKKNITYHSEFCLTSVSCSLFLYLTKGTYSFFQGLSPIWIHSQQLHFPKVQQNWITAQRESDLFLTSSQSIKRKK